MVLVTEQCHPSIAVKVPGSYGKPVCNVCDQRKANRPVANAGNEERLPHGRLVPFKIKLHELGDRLRIAIRIVILRGIVGFARAAIARAHRIDDIRGPKSSSVPGPPGPPLV